MTKQLNVRLDDDLHSWLVGRASREKRSLNGHIEYLLEQDRAVESMRAKQVVHLDGDPLNNDPGNLELRERPS